MSVIDPVKENTGLSSGQAVKDITEQSKGAWGMPRLSEAKKDVTSCEKPRGEANTP